MNLSFKKSQRKNANHGRRELKVPHDTSNACFPRKLETRGGKLREIRGALTTGCQSSSSAQSEQGSLWTPVFV